MRALAKDPDARFKDADAFLKALDAAEKAPDTPRPQDTAAYAAVTPEGETDMPGDEEPYDDEEQWERDRRRRRWRWIILALLAAGVAALVAFALTRPSHVAVPDVIGQDVDAATQILDGKGFDVAIKAVPSGAPRNQVVEQDPIPTDRGGGKAEEGSTVTLSVSSGPAIVAVPDVAGLSAVRCDDTARKGRLQGDDEGRVLEHGAQGQGDRHGAGGRYPALDQSGRHAAGLARARTRWRSRTSSVSMTRPPWRRFRTRASPGSWCSATRPSRRARC